MLKDTFKRNKIFQRFSFLNGREFVIFFFIVSNRVVNILNDSPLALRIILYRSTAPL